ncbi:MAG: dethiobiotin synthase [Eubacteriales bacterium]|nr:dethiobiotin synthase [Eubacteriales bacterium]
MAKSIFITGTGTDVGKTYVTALIIKKLHDAGLKAAYYKAAMSGNVRDEKGALIPGDAKWVKDISLIEQTLEETCPYVYETAVSPHLASRLEGNPVKMKKVLECYEALCAKYDYITVEGSGGILCPIDFDNERIQLEDIIKELKLSSLIIADAGLGTINSVVLTVEYMKKRGMDVKGIIFNNWCASNMMHEDNKFMCELMTGLPVLAMVEKNAKKINIDIEQLISLYD